MASVFNTTIVPQIILDELPSPLVLLPSQQVHNILISTYIHLGTFSVVIWDVLNNLRSDWNIGSSVKRRIVSVVYFSTRISLLTYSIGRAVLLTHTMKSCTALQDILTTFLIVFVVSTGLLFYLYICTLYPMDRTVAGFFGALYLAVISMACTYSKAFSAEHIGSTLYCMEKPAGALLGPALAIQFVNEFLLYVAIARRMFMKLLNNTRAQSTANLRAWPFGTTLNAVEQFIFLEQNFYCATIVATKAFLVCAVYAFTPPVNTMLYIVHLVLTNVWCGRIYRNINNSVCPGMISQTEFELRLGVQTQTVPVSVLPEQELEVRPQDHQGDTGREGAHGKEDVERTSSITYHVRGGIKS